MKKLIIPFFLFLAACGHHRDVRPGASGVHKVVIATDNKEEGSREAIQQANHFCKQYDKIAAFVDEKQDYVGDMDEKKYKEAKKVTDVAKVVGGAVSVFGGQRESGVGGVVALGGLAGDVALGKGYSVTMSFRCQ